MRDTTKAAQMLDELSNNRMPPPPSVAKDGRSPFSFLPSVTQSKQAQPAPNNTGTSPNGNANANNTSAVATTNTKGAATKWVAVVKDKCSKVLKTQGIAAVVVFVIVAGVMAAVNPPIVQTKSTNPDEKPKRSVVKILIWAVVAAALVMVIPLGIEYAKKKKISAGAASSSGSTTSISATPSGISVK